MLKSFFTPYVLLNPQRPILFHFNFSIMIVVLTERKLEQVIGSGFQKLKSSRILKNKLDYFSSQ